MRTRPVLVIAAAATALVLAGCGDDGGSASSTSTPTPAATSTASAAAGTDASNVLAAVAKAAGQASTAKATIATTGGSQDVIGKGEFAYGDDPSAKYTVSLPGDGPDQQISMILVDGTLYLNLAGLGVGELAGSKTWVTVSTDGTDTVSKRFQELADSLTQAGDITSSLELLQAGATVTDEGPDTVDGVATTRYLITTDVAKAITESSGTTRRGLQDLKDQGIDTVTSTLWVDAENLPVKYQQATTLKGDQVTTTVRYSGWGEPVSITAPPASQVGSIKDLLGA